MLEPPDLDGSTAFVTGTTRGIGIEIALALADAGCTVVSTGKTVEAAAEEAIDTRATRYFGLGTADDWRSPEIVSDAVLAILSRDPAEVTGNAVYDEEVLREAGVEEFSRYNLTEGDPAPMSAQMFDPDFERPA
jgi:NAD(P)-dependent dehydrogenase (short-subunit alcohol dehydrogenase family)